MRRRRRARDPAGAMLRSWLTAALLATTPDLSAKPSKKPAISAQFSSIGLDGLEKALRIAERDIPDWFLQDSDDEDDDLDDDDSHPDSPEIDIATRLRAGHEIGEALNAEQFLKDAATR